MHPGRLQVRLRLHERCHPRPLHSQALAVHRRGQRVHVHRGQYTPRHLREPDEQNKSVRSQTKVTGRHYLNDVLLHIFIPLRRP